MDVDRHRGVRLDRLADERADREIGNVMVVHHVEVQEIGARGDHRAHFVAEAREVRGQERRRDQVVGHGSIILRTVIGLRLDMADSTGNTRSRSR